MRLESFGVRGFKSLADVSAVPVRQPTIVTGENDGGKSSALEALAFLLGERIPALEDYTRKQDAQGAAVFRHVEEIVVSGEFSLSDTEREELHLPETVSLRRKVVAGTGKPVLEVLVEAPKDEDLRGIDNMNMASLKALAAKYHVEPEGNKTVLATWREPLRELAASAPQVPAWIPASKDVVDRLPGFLLFSSREEPDPEVQIRTVLQAEYKRLLSDPDFIKPVRDLEGQIQERLQDEAKKLCAHILDRIPELESVTAIPSVSFREAFNSVQLRAGAEGVGLPQAGAGRQRRISLAVWEWIAMPREEGDNGPLDLVVAYDEPDTHLDYERQRNMMKLIHTQCKVKGVRMIVATHSLNLIDGVDIADVVQFRRDEGGRTRVEILEDESHDGVDRYLSQIARAMGLRTSVMLHERCFLAVEGPTEQQTFPLLFRLATGRPFQSAGIALICGDGNDGALQVVKFLIKHRRTVTFIVDTDSKTDRRKIFREDKLHASGVRKEQIHFVGDKELEDLYSDAQWVGTANAEWPRTDGRLWVEQDISDCRAKGKFSGSLLSLFKLSSESGPQSKQEMNIKLVLRLKDAAEIPEQLRMAFRTIETLANEKPPS